MLGTGLVVRAKRAVKAFREAPEYAITYVWHNDGENYECYLGYFSDELEAQQAFVTMFGSDSDVHDAYLVQVVKEVRPPKSD